MFRKGWMKINYHKFGVFVVLLSLLTLIMISNHLFFIYKFGSQFHEEANARSDLDIHNEIMDLKSIKTSLNKELIAFEQRRNFLLKEIKNLEEILDSNFKKIANSVKLDSKHSKAKTV